MPKSLLFKALLPKKWRFIQSGALIKSGVLFTQIRYKQVAFLLSFVPQQLLFLFSKHLDTMSIRRIVSRSNRSMHIQNMSIESWNRSIWQLTSVLSASTVVHSYVCIFCCFLLQCFGRGDNIGQPPTDMFIHAKPTARTRIE